MILPSRDKICRFGTDLCPLLELPPSTNTFLRYFYDSVGEIFYRPPAFRRLGLRFNTKTPMSLGAVSLRCQKVLEMPSQSKSHCRFYQRHEPKKHPRFSSEQPHLSQRSRCHKCQFLSILHKHCGLYIGLCTCCLLFKT
jgi:hypothetical protein